MVLTGNGLRIARSKVHDHHAMSRDMINDHDRQTALLLFRLGLAVCDRCSELVTAMEYLFRFLFSGAKGGGAFPRPVSVRTL